MKADREDKIVKAIELDRFRKTLKATLADLNKRRNYREALAIETSADELDRIQHAQERDLAMEALHRESMRFSEIRDALERMDSGSFGVCINCEGEIAAKRLAAVPWTPLCIVCQEVADRMAVNSHDGDEQPLLTAV